MLDDIVNIRVSGSNKKLCNLNKKMWNLAKYTIKPASGCLRFRAYVGGRQLCPGPWNPIYSGAELSKHDEDGYHGNCPDDIRWQVTLAGGVQQQYSIGGEFLVSKP